MDGEFQLDKNCNGSKQSTKYLRTSRVANQTINRFGHLILLQIFAKFVNTSKRIQFAFHNVKVVHVEIVNFGNSFHFINIADGSDNMVLIGGEEILYSLATKARGAAGDDYQFCNEEHVRYGNVELQRCKYKILNHSSIIR